MHVVSSPLVTFSIRTDGLHHAAAADVITDRDAAYSAMQAGVISVWCLCARNTECHSHANK
jgi:hypothetical protein